MKYTHEVFDTHKLNLVLYAIYEQFKKFFMNYACDASSFFVISLLYCLHIFFYKASFISY